MPLPCAARLLPAALAAPTFLLLAMSPAFTGPQEPVKEPAPPGPSTKSRPVDPPVAQRGPNLKLAEERVAEITRMLARYNTEPQPLPPIPDNPPPHEGAMIGLPHIIEPSDLMLIEVLEALPGRPISGERLVRPDGTVNLGFYGEVVVKGLILEQAKVKIIKHLRAFLRDEELGLETGFEEVREPPPILDEPPTQPVPKGEANPSDLPQPQPQPPPQPKPRSTSLARPPNGASARSRSTLRRETRGPRSIRQILAQESPFDARVQTAPAPANQVTVPRSGRGATSNTISVDGQNRPAAALPEDMQPLAEPPAFNTVYGGNGVIVPPEKSDRVFVDITAYNSRNYHVVGDVVVVGRLPSSGHETVLDAIYFAGGLLATADPKDIRLARPARGGKPAKVYKVDLEAIQDKGDSTTNYQIFPGDRLIVGRNEVVKKTVELDRLTAPIQALMGTLNQEASLLKSMQYGPNAERDVFLKELADFWARSITQQGSGQLDERALRDALMRVLKSTADRVPAGR
jgi:protein involved in polysaccharide export with SLBB domain